MVVTFVCARDRTPHVERGRKPLQTYGFPVQIYMGKLQRAVILILRCESKIDLIFETSLYILHSHKISLPKSVSKYLIISFESLFLLLM